ncbi:hypothetical protein ACRALDRAFT_212195 [Sodiomyces alcalophilus JCM 7366]|uniref:uncharacterized protein n=1 Tax=Sodiomyces alcalophilus JCM 7366 TaxID=591952 RepID=UPI0039B4B951
MAPTICLAGNGINSTLTLVYLPLHPAGYVSSLVWIAEGAGRLGLPVAGELRNLVYTSGSPSKGRHSIGVLRERDYSAAIMASLHLGDNTCRVIHPLAAGGDLPWTVLPSPHDDDDDDDDSNDDDNNDNDNNDYDDDKATKTTKTRTIT